MKRSCNTAAKMAPLGFELVSNVTAADWIGVICSGIAGLWHGGAVSTTTSKDEAGRWAFRTRGAGEPPHLGLIESTKAGSPRRTEGYAHLKAKVGETG